MHVGPSKGVMFAAWTPLFSTFFDIIGYEKPRARFDQHPKNMGLCFSIAPSGRDVLLVEAPDVRHGTGGAKEAASFDAGARQAQRQGSGRRASEGLGWCSATLGLSGDQGPGQLGKAPCTSTALAGCDLATSPSWSLLRRMGWRRS